jgi:hypothetical protein
VHLTNHPSGRLRRRLTQALGFKVKIVGMRFAMDRVFFNEITRLGGDPSDEIWIWLLTRGPHGSKFTWGQTRKEPAGYIGVNHLERVVSELTENIPDFEQRAKAIVNVAFESQFPEIVRRAIQVAAVIGGVEELQKVKQFEKNEPSEVASDARPKRIPKWCS